jgi:hypothetical protein
MNQCVPVKSTGVGVGGGCVGVGVAKAPVTAWQANKVAVRAARVRAATVEFFTRDSPLPVWVGFSRRLTHLTPIAARSRRDGVRCEVEGLCRASTARENSLDRGTRPGRANT